jgi:hypothetical protein
LHHKNEKWIETLALEAETAINNLEITEQNYYRHVVSRKIKDIYRNDKERKRIETNNEHKKQNSKEQTITKADKGKTLVILKQEEYKHKINNFIHDNHFIKSDENPTQHQKLVKLTLKQCNNIIRKEDRWKYTNMKMLQ